ncbi:Phenylalanine--tRNA ligase alpha subunit [archaeon HR06]|nr:Phenylalanine--tRNA ligase alpha subunit [archaeon HR06]
MALHSLEKRIIMALKDKGEMSLEDLSRETKLSLDHVRRATEWLRLKKLLDVRKESNVKVKLDEEGIKAYKEGLPERKIIKRLKDEGGKIDLRELSKEFDKKEISASLGRLKLKGIVEVRGNEVILIKDTYLDEEKIISKLYGDGKYLEDFNDYEKRILMDLKRRPRFIKEEEEAKFFFKLKEEARNLVISLDKEIDRLSPDLLISGEWRNYSLRPYDVEAPVSLAPMGKKHPLQSFIDEVREIFISMGFEEIEGPLVQPSFWNFDALFIPQDHPARELQDTFYLSNLMAKGSGGEYRSIIAKVHEKGGFTGSKGWGYKWREIEADRLVLRTHTTAVTIEYLAKYKPKKARIFSVGRVFRNEKVTYKNLVEFHQIEGIVVGREVNLRDLMGLLTKFYHKLGLKEVKFWPSFFPYTEPSLQSVVYFDKLNRWVELCGMGIFRPEVTLPFGVREPVLAWGGGLERLVMLKYDIKDVRELYKNDINWLRRLKLCP